MRRYRAHYDVIVMLFADVLAPDGTGASVEAVVSTCVSVYHDSLLPLDDIMNSFNVVDGVSRNLVIP